MIGSWPISNELKNAFPAWKGNSNGDARVESLYPGLRPLAYRCLQDMRELRKTPVKVTSAYRSLIEQRNLYALGRTHTGTEWKVADRAKIVTYAKPGYSWHCYGLAFDVAFVGPDPYLARLPEHECEAAWHAYGRVVKSHGLTWGGDFSRFKDRPHAEKSFGLSLSEAAELYEYGGLPAVWVHLDKLLGAGK